MSSGRNPKATFDLSTFTFGDHTLRTVQIDGEPWFVQRDVFLILYGKTTGVGAATHTAIPQEGKKVIRKVSAPETLRSLFNVRGTYQLALLSEPALYQIVMRSETSAAKAFPNWVTQVDLRNAGPCTLQDAPDQQELSVCPLG